MSNNLNLDQVSAGQTNKEATINTATGQLDAALTENLTVDLSLGNVSLSNLQWRSAVRFEITPAAASRTLTVPQIKKLAVVDNRTAFTVGLVRGTTTINLDPNATYLVYQDGTANGLFAYKMVSTTSISEPYDVAVSIANLTTNAEDILFFVFPRPATLPAGATGSQAKAAAAATGATTYTVRKNGGSIGTIDFAASGTVGTFNGFGTTNFVAGDVLSITGPATADATLADLAITIKLTRTG